MVRNTPFPPLCLLLSSLVCGCGTGSGWTRTGNDGVTAIQFSDIPVPAGMKLLERFHRSDSIQVGDYRYGNFAYSGTVPVAEVSQYLRERMPQHGWKLAERQQEKEGEVLVFRRGPYTARCQLSSDGVTTIWNLAVRTRKSPPAGQGQ